MSVIAKLTSDDKVRSSFKIYLQFLHTVNKEKTVNFFPNYQVVGCPISLIGDYRVSKNEPMRKYEQRHDGTVVLYSGEEERVLEVTLIGCVKTEHFPNRSPSSYFKSISPNGYSIRDFPVHKCISLLPYFSPFLIRDAVLFGYYISDSGPIIRAECLTKEIKLLPKT